MRQPRALAAALAAVGLISAVLGAAPGSLRPVRAADYHLVSQATYTVRPEDHLVGVVVHVQFRNSTPNPPGHFSVFEVIDLAVQEAATDVRATDHLGKLKVTLSRRNGVTIASVRPRKGVRYRDSTEFTLRYTLNDPDSGSTRIRQSIVRFPVWSFGTQGNVEVRIPAAYEVLVDGNSLTAERSGDSWRLKSGPIADPTRWLAVLTATQPSTFTVTSTSVGMRAGSLEVQVHSWAGDRAWGRRTLDLARRTLPSLERAIGLELPTDSPLVLVESLPAAGGALSEPAPEGTDIAVGFDEGPFTIIHQLAHAWFTPELAADQWIREGFASQAALAASKAAGGIHGRAPFDPAAEARTRAKDAFPLVSWGAGEATARQDRYAYAASWAAASELASEVGKGGMRQAWLRFAAGLDGYQPLDATPTPGQLAEVPADSRHLMDQLEAISGKDLSAIFERWVFDDATKALLPARTTARQQANQLLKAAGDWGMPDPVRLALAGWRFDDATAAITEAQAWLRDRDVLTADIRAAALTVPDRLRDEYRTGGGTSAARTELNGEQAVVDDYVAASSLLTKARSVVEEVGLLGGDDPRAQLGEARTAFEEGDLTGASELAGSARDRLETASRDGLVRIVSAVVVAVALVVGLVWLIRGRRQRRVDGYTAGP